MLGKISIIIDTLLPMFACFQLCRALKNSYVIDSKLNAAQPELQQRSLMFLLAEDQTLYKRATRVVIILLLLANFLLTTWSISRMFNDFASYATGWIEATAVIFHIIMAVIAQFVFLINYHAHFSFLKRIKI